MPVLSKVAVGVAALVGGASAGSLTSTTYTDSQCAVRETECGLDDVNMPADGSDCAAANVTDKPAMTEQWVSGECLACPAGEECAFPFFQMEDEIGQLLVAQGVNPAYAQITCTGGVATVEHFSDAECTEANKVSNDALTTGLTAVMMDSLPADDRALLPCINLEMDYQSGVSISGTHCDTVMAVSFDEVRTRFPRRTRARGGSELRAASNYYGLCMHVWRQACLTTVLTDQGVPAEQAAATAAEMAANSEAQAIELTVTGCTPPPSPPADASGSGRVAPAVMLAFAALLAN